MVNGWGVKLKMCLKKIWEHLKRNGGKYWFLFILLSSIFLYIEVFPDYSMGSKEFDKIEVNDTNETKYSIEKILYDEFDITNIPGSIYRFIYNKGGFNKICFKDLGSGIYYNEENLGYIEMFIKFNDNTLELVEKNTEFCQEINTNELFTFWWVVGMKLNSEKLKDVPEEGIINVYPKVETYLKGTQWFKVFKFAFIFLSFGAVCWAWTRGFHLIRYGMWGK